MKIIGYTRVSTDQQDLFKQKHLLLEYAQKNQWLISEFIEVEISAQKSQQERKIDILLHRLETGDKLLVAELSRLGRNMLETLNIINNLSEKGVDILFVRQPELSTSAPHAKLLMAIYSYFAEAERNYISIRTKQGLAAARSKGKKLGRPKGSKNKKTNALKAHHAEINQYLNLGLSVVSIMKIINPKLEKTVGYHSFQYFIKNEIK
jgi:DNA invertase Pin-like site-specific DNA recombinase